MEATATIVKGAAGSPTNGATMYDYYRPRDTRTKWQKFKDDIYNPREHTFLGRTRSKWGVFGAFYLVFYTVLALLCALCGAGLMYTLDEHRPTFTMESSLIGINPGLGFRPIHNDSARGSMIAFNSDNYTEWTLYITEFLATYKFKDHLPNGGRNQMPCDDKFPTPGKVCAFNVQEQLGPCAIGGTYGYNSHSPCVFVKLNKIIDWKPDFYNDPKDLPKDMPEDLKAHIARQPPGKRDAVWVSCRSENKVNSNDIGNLTYFPKERGFPTYYYPYTNQPEYVSPLVAVHFERPAVNTHINVECRAWAKNIKYGSSKGEKVGAVHFELLITKPEDTKVNKTKA